MSAHVIGGDPSVSCGLLRETFLMLGMEFVPQRLELPGKRPDQIFLFGYDKILMISGDGGSCPVETAIHHRLSVDDGEFVVHQIRSVVMTDPDAFVSEFADLRSGDTKLFAVCDHANNNIPVLLTIDQRRHQIGAGDAEDANIE